MEAAEIAGCQARLCLVSYWEHGYGEYWGNQYKEEEECYNEYEISERASYAHHLLKPTAGKVSVDKIPLDDEQIIANVPLIGGPGKESSISEATGNEGATRDLWYHRGAILLWPNEAWRFLTKIIVTGHGRWR